MLEQEELTARLEQDSDDLEPYYMRAAPEISNSKSKTLQGKINPYNLSATSELLLSGGFTPNVRSLNDTEQARNSRNAPIVEDSSDLMSTQNQIENSINYNKIESIIKKLSQVDKD